ncbi:hypothetical protein BROUX41_000659 [Berkeleyomyces rouxiae]|uniref:uncharacterized protein n=1 Tax=Berkeleyomyces rouxiae TaxID=2035830 RepID=UPI003B7ABA1D
MPPLCRYLQISKYHILECHIYTDPPALQHSWLLNPRKPLLDRIFEHIKPTVIPKVRQARENDHWGKKKKPAQKKPDIMVTDEFEVAITLLPTSERHSVLQKHRHLSDRASYRLQSSTKGLIAQSHLAPIDVDAENDGYSAAATVILEESDDDQPVFTAPVALPQRRSKRPRSGTIDGDGGGNAGDATVTSTPGSQAGSNQGGGSASEQGDLQSRDGSGIFVSSGEEDNQDETNAASDTTNQAKRMRQLGLADDDKKKMKMDISYEGFAVYGHILCLVVKKPSPAGAKRSGRGGRAKHEPGAMESWLSTQLPAQDYDH